MGEMEIIYTFEEAKDSFINGQFIATIILAQSFIEKLFHAHFIERGLDSIAKRGLSAMIKHGRKTQIISGFFLDRADELRKIRNPFTHLKEYDYPHKLSNRMYVNKTQPYEQLEKDAKNAISIMILVAIQKF